MKLRHSVGATLPRVGGASDTDTCRKRTRRGVGSFFFCRTRPSLWMRKRYVCGAAKSGTWTPVAELPVAELQLQSCPLQSCHQIHGEEKGGQKIGKGKLSKTKKNLKRKHNHILINLIIQLFNMKFVLILRIPNTNTSIQFSLYLKFS